MRGFPTRPQRSGWELRPQSLAGVGGTPQQWEEGLGQREGLRGQPSERSVRFPKPQGTNDFPELGANKGSGYLQVGRAQGDCWECRARVILGILHPEQRPEGWEERRASGERHPPPQLGACQALSPQSVSTGPNTTGGPWGVFQEPHRHHGVPHPRAPGSPQWSRQEPAGLAERRRWTPSRKEAEGEVTWQKARRRG